MTNSGAINGHGPHNSGGGHSPRGELLYYLRNPNERPPDLRCSRSSILLEEGAGFKAEQGFLCMTGPSRSRAWYRTRRLPVSQGLPSAARRP